MRAADAARAGSRTGPKIIDGEFKVIDETIKAADEGTNVAKPIRPIAVPIADQLGPDAALKLALGAAEAHDAGVATKPTDRPAEVPPVVAPAEPVYKPSNEMIKAAKVNLGEGPWQSAERMLRADGKRHDVDEVRALTKAIQQVYGANPDNPPMDSLKVNHNFVNDTAQSYNALINAVTDSRVKALLVKFAAM